MVSRRMSTDALTFGCQLPSTPKQTVLAHDRNEIHSLAHNCSGAMVCVRARSVCVYVCVDMCVCLYGICVKNVYVCMFMVCVGGVGRVYRMSVCLCVWCVKCLCVSMCLVCKEFVRVCA